MQYCSECGTKLISKECYNCGIYEGLVPYCPNCEVYRFSLFNVAVSTVIYNKDLSKLLLVRQYGKDWNILVAGYVSKGESLEEALKREISEEVGLKIQRFKFNASRYFPKSNSLICNFITVTECENVVCNNEVDYAKWYCIDEAKEAILHNGLAEYFFLESLNKLESLR